MDAGNYTVKAVYNGDENYTASNTAANLTVSKNNVTITAYPASAVYTDTGVINVTGDVSGTYYVVVNGTAIIVDVAAGVNSSVNIPVLVPGLYNVSVEYKESANYNAKTVIFENYYEVIKKDINVTLTVSNIDYKGVAVVVNDAPLDAVASVNYTITNKETGEIIQINDSSFTASVSVGDLAAGNYTVSAVYSGDDLYNVNVAGANFTVNPVAPEFSISSNDVVWNSTVNVVPSITEGASGNIQYLINGSLKATLDVGETFTISALAVGQDNITAVYSGDVNYTGVNASVIVNVNPAKGNISAYDVSIDIGNNVTYNFTLPQSYSGKVNVSINNITASADANGSNTSVTLDTSALAAGTYKVTVRYGDDWNVTDAADSAMLTVNKLVSNTTISVCNIKVGENGDFNISVTPGDANGTVLIYLNDTLTAAIVLVDGTARFNASSLTAGEYNIVANYSGNDIYQDSVSDVASFNVVKNDIVVSVDAPEVQFGETQVVTVTLSGNDASGTVNITVGTPEFNDLNIYGAKVVVNPDLGVGVYDVVVKYSGDDKYFDNVSTASFTVSKVKDYNVTINTSPSAFGDNATIEITYPKDATGNVTVSVDGENYTVVNLTNGTATVTLPDNLTVGDHNITVTVDDEIYAPVNFNTTLHVMEVYLIANNLTRGFNSDFDYQASLIAEDGSPVKGKNLTFTINGKTYSVLIDYNGTAFLNLNLTVGSYSVLVNNPLNDANATATLKIVPRLVGSSNIKMYYADGSKFKVRVVGDNGSFVGAGVSIEITIHNVIYNVVTDNNGYAVLSVNLKPGKYQVISKYKGYTVKNNVKVKHVIRAKKITKVKKSAKKLKIKIKLKGKKVLKKQKLKVKFRGKTYKVKTNKKGKATLKIKKKVLKKLKKGKKYKYKITYKFDTLKRYVKVK